MKTNAYFNSKKFEETLEKINQKNKEYREKISFLEKELAKKEHEVKDKNPDISFNNDTLHKVSSEDIKNTVKLQKSMIDNFSVTLKNKDTLLDEKNNELSIVKEQKEKLSKELNEIFEELENKNTEIESINNELYKWKSELKTLVSTNEQLNDVLDEIISPDFKLKRIYSPNVINDLDSFNLNFNTLIKTINKSVVKEQNEFSIAYLDDYFMSQNNNENRINFFTKNQFYNLMRFFNSDILRYSIVYMDRETSSDKSLAKSIFKNYKCAYLKYFNDNVRKDIEVINEAIKSDPKNILYAITDDDSYIELFKNNFENNIKIIQYSNELVTNNKDLFFYSKSNLKRDTNGRINLYFYPELLFFLEENILSDTKLLKEAIKDYGYVLNYLPKKYKYNQDFIIETLANCPRNIKLFSFNLEDETQVADILLIVEQYPETFNYLDSNDKEKINQITNKVQEKDKDSLSDKNNKKNQKKLENNFKISFKSLFKRE